MGKRGFIAGLLLGGAVVALARRFGKSAKAPEALPKAGAQEPPQGFSITFGDPIQQQKFAQEYITFLLEWRELQGFVKEVMLNRVIHPPDMEPLKDLADDDPLVLAAEDRYKADISSFMMARIAVDDFSELLTLASNGWGNGAMKTLRGIYERIVTSAYVALFPEVSRSLVESTWTQQWKVWKRAVALKPDIADQVSQDTIDELQQRAAEAQARHEESICKKCKQLIQVHAWTKVDLETMAKKVDEKLTELNLPHGSLADYYLRCYLQPTAIAHATGTSVNERFELVDGQWTYKMDSSREKRQAMMFGHAILLLLLGRQIQHFSYGLDDQLTVRVKAFRKTWDLLQPGQI
jgi:hypothetical protein